MKSPTRMAELLDLAAEQLEAGSSPFADGWLTDNEVTYDECMGLSETLAVAARVLATGLREPEVLRAAINGAETVRAYGHLNRTLGKLVRR